jgi:parvulin-like peptidyl-prolyl isomerase
VIGGFVLLLAQSWFAGCSPKEEIETDPVVIHFGDQLIRLSELQMELDAWTEQGAMSVSLDQFAVQYVERLKALAEARTLGLDQDVELRHQYENLLIGRLKQQQLQGQLAALEISDQDIEVYYDSNLDRYTKEGQVRVALLYLSASDKLDEERRLAIKERLEVVPSLIDEIPSEARGFGAYAMEYSEEATSRFKGGDIGWMQSGAISYRWPKSVVQAAFALQSVGNLSPVIEAVDGFYLLMMLDSRDTQVRPLDASLRTSIHRKLFNQERTNLTESIQAEWGMDTPVQVNETALSQLNFKSTSDVPAQSSKELSGMHYSN